MFEFISRVLWQVDVPYFHKGLDSTHVDLGGGGVPRNPFGAKNLICADLHDWRTESSKSISNFVAIDIRKQFPFPDNSIDSFSAFDVIEHIPRIQDENGTQHYPFINFMSEIYRSLKPGGIFIALTPAYPHAYAFEHPTHINFVSEGTIYYFTEALSESLRLGYGSKSNFQLIQQQWQRGAGPFEDPGNLQYRMLKNGTSFERIKCTIVIIVRYMRLLGKGEKSHLLWVLQKPIGETLHSA